MRVSTRTPLLDYEAKMPTGPRAHEAEILGARRRRKNVRYAANRERLPVTITLEPAAYDDGKSRAKALGFSSFSRYVEAMIANDERARQKSATAFAIAPVVRLGEAAVAALFGMRDAAANGELLSHEAISLLGEIRDAAHATLRALRDRYDAELDENIRYVHQDDWERTE